MKKLFLFVLLIAGVSIAGQAQLKFYYYPASNVYYDVAKKNYVYQSNGSWRPVTVLPANLKAAGGPRYIVYNQTPDVWVKNNTHVKKYKAPKQKHMPQGKAVGYKGSNPNKAIVQVNGKAKGHSKSSKH
jgi:hypothetical protein